MTADRNAVEVERTALAAPNQKGNTMQHYRGKKAAFLKSVRVTYAIAPAADKIGVHRCTVHRWMQADPGFAEAVEDARQAAIDDIEAITSRKHATGIRWHGFTFCEAGAVTSTATAKFQANANRGSPNHCRRRRWRSL